MELREVFADEIIEVAKLYNELAYYIQKETQDVYWDFEDLSLENISSHLSSYIGHPERKIFIAKDNEILIGFIVGEIIKCHLPISSIKDIGYISAAFVLPLYRGKGIMKRLESLQTEFFRQEGLNFMELNFVSQNLLAKKSWEGLGYKTFREQARKEI